ncbi:hypothetical protein CAEBREN_19458 [Caenorhabditis brenneri]|uniref:F-box domain-containing protein n=1 Tax=Caenorhabditis brenneri TaxID=135651 RepID=G0N2L9_CAEBE|nr:hypothetical protein CAEBREN_19458 [Caenorhabditis brenneri]
MSSFPVLRLPHVALTEVLRCLDPIDLYIFAQCSSKASFVVPLVRSKNFRIGVNNESIRKVTINECYTFSHEKLNREGFEKFIWYICDLFKSPIRNVCYNPDFDQISSNVGFETFIWFFCNLFWSPMRTIDFLPVMEFGQITSFLLKIDQIGIEELEITGYKLTANVMRKTLDAVQRTKISLALSIKSYVSKGFGYNFSRELPERLKVESAHWFTMRNLMQARSCAHIDLHGSRLTIQDMKEFMRRWKQGEFPNLEYFQTSNDSFNITDYPGFEDRGNTVQRNKRIKNCHSLRYMTRGVGIERDNGQKAEYRIYGNWFQFFVLSEWDI